MRGRSLTALIAAFLFLGAGSARGSGFGIFTQGGAALGEADAVVAHGERPSSIFFNPALIARLEGTQLEVGTTLIFPGRSFAGDDGSQADTRDTVFTPSTIYLTHAVNRTLSAGFGIFSPFGLGTDWGGEWSGRYLITDASLTSYALNPVLCWRPVPTLSLAAGADFLLVDATLEGKIPSTALGIPGPPFDLTKRFTGSGNGVGYNVGILWEPGESLAIGASYRSVIRVTLDGDLSVGGTPAGNGKSRITLPQQLFFGVAYRFTERLLLESGIRYEDWSSLEAIRIDFPAAPSLGPETGESEDPREWRGSVAVNLGGEYRLSRRLAVSGGYLYGFNPVPDRTFEPAIPDADTHLFCAGTQLTWEKVRLDLGYGYQLQKRRSKETNRYGASANGRYEVDAHLAGFSLGYRF